MDPTTFLWRLRNALVRLAARVSLGGESVSPLVANDLFVAHLAVYDFFARRLATTGPARLLDLGSDTGYGAAHLHRSLVGATVVGLDVDRRSVRFARRRFDTEGLRYVESAAEEMERALAGEPPFDAVVSSNALEHLVDARPVVSSVARLLGPAGQFLAAVPPICDAAALAENEKNPFHLSNLHVTAWHALLSERFRQVRCFRQTTARDVDPDFHDPRPSSLDPSAFPFDEVPVERFCDRFGLGAVFVCTEPLAPMAPGTP